MATQMDISIPDYRRKPFVVLWEPTRACDLACHTCRATAQPNRSSFELSTFEAYKLIDQIAMLDVRSFVITGGDPLKRPDLYELIDYTHRRRLEPSLTPSATPLLTHDAIKRLEQAGVARIAVSLDGSTAEEHDAHRGVPGSFDLTIDSVRFAVSVGIPVQINTTITRRNSGELEAMARLLATLGVETWNVYFLVPTGRRTRDEMIPADETERIFEAIYRISGRSPFAVTVSEAAHYRRFLAQKRMAEDRDAVARLFDPATADAEISRAGGGAAKPRLDFNEARGFLFISHIGEVYPSNFLPMSGGNVRHQTLAEIYRHSALFTTLRDPAKLKGKCGICEYRQLCGGSRARAFATTGDPLESDPLCCYEPSK